MTIQHIITLALLGGLVACSGTPSAPTGVPHTATSTAVASTAPDVPTAAAVASIDVPPQPAPPAALTALPGGALAQLVSFNPPLECGHGLAQPNMQQVITDDGRTFYRFRFANTGAGVSIGYIVFEDDTGDGRGDGGPCGAFTHKPTGGYIRLVSGAWSYDANQTNVETVLEYLHERLECGRVQIDVAINRMLVIGQLRRSGTNCVPPPPPPVVPPPPTPPTPPRTPPTSPSPPPPSPTCETDSSLCQPPPPPPVDVCVNLPGNQETIPPGYERNAQGVCTPIPPPPPPPQTCVGPWSYGGTNPFGLANSGDATELAHVHAYVSPLLTGPVKTSLTTTTWTSDGAYPVVIVKSAQVYFLYTNVTLGQVLVSPATNQNGQVQAISHVSRFACPAQ